MENRCVYDTSFTDIANNEKFILTISIGYMEIKSQFHELSKEIRNSRNNGFIYDQILKLTIKNYASLSNKNIQYY